MNLNLILLLPFLALLVGCSNSSNNKSAEDPIIVQENIDMSAPKQKPVTSESLDEVRSFAQLIDDGDLGSFILVSTDETPGTSTQRQARWNRATDLARRLVAEMKQTCQIQMPTKQTEGSLNAIPGSTSTVSEVAQLTGSSCAYVSDRKERIQMKVANYDSKTGLMTLRTSLSISHIDKVNSPEWSRATGILGTTLKASGSGASKGTAGVESSVVSYIKLNFESTTETQGGNIIYKGPVQAVIKGKSIQQLRADFEIQFPDKTDKVMMTILFTQSETKMFVNGQPVKPSDYTGFDPSGYLN